jgi:threonine aldolase
MFGGAMRQAGIIAAGGIYGLEHNVQRLADDHTRAARLARGLAEIPGLRLDPDEVETNIVYFDVADTGLTATEFNNLLKERGVRMAAGSYGPSRVRAVTHLDVTAADIEQAVAVVAAVVTAHRQPGTGPAGGRASATPAGRPA